jgi:SAM-dependent methyltransferase
MTSAVQTQTVQTQAIPETASATAFQRYYEEAGPDYASWSQHFNMHFGYFRSGMNPFRREAMLEQMNREIFDRLHIGTQRNPKVLDLGCGLAATLRSFSRLHPQAILTGVTLVPWQLEHGNTLNRTGPQATRDTRSIYLLRADYERTRLPSASYDAVYAVESSCYGRGGNKSAFLTEAHRLLRPGGRLVVADGFLSRPNALRGAQKAIFRHLCDCWVIDTLGEIPAFTAELTRLGFRKIVVEPAQARVAPSVLHIPFVTLKFLLTEVVFGKRRMSRARWNNLLAPILLPFVGKPLGPMAYYLISATKP